MLYAELISLLMIFINTGFLQKGDKIPSFELKTEKGLVWKSDDFKGKKNLIIYFYPAAMTPGCTVQACGFRDDKDEILKYNAEIIGISGDEPESLMYFKEEYNLNFTLLSDKNGTVAKLFGVPVKDGGVIEKEIKGKNVELKRGITTARWTFVVDKEGRIIYKNESVKAANDSDNIIEVLKQIN